MMTIADIDLSGLVLSRGNHEKADDAVCVMEAASILGCALKAPEPIPTWAEALARFRDCKTDYPADGCRVIGAFARHLNDWVTDAERQRLVPYAKALAASRVPPAVEVKRALVMADVAVRVFAPMALDARGFTQHAATLRAADPIINEDTAEAGRQKAGDAADAARSDDAGDAAGAARFAALPLGAPSAARFAADAGDNAADAARFAADAGGDAARLMDAALTAIDRMLEITA